MLLHLPFLLLQLFVLEAQFLLVLLLYLQDLRFILDHLLDLLFLRIVPSQSWAIIWMLFLFSIPLKEIATADKKKRLSSESIASVWLRLFLRFGLQFWFFCLHFGLGARDDGGGGDENNEGRFLGIGAHLFEFNFLELSLLPLHKRGVTAKLGSQVCTSVILVYIIAVSNKKKRGGKVGLLSQLTRLKALPTFHYFNTSGPESQKYA